MVAFAAVRADIHSGCDMTDSLFRQEAVDASHRGALGSVTLHTPPYRWLLLGVVAVFVVSALLLLGCGAYTARERALGELLPEQGVLNLVPPVSGTVTRIFVREGQAVERGAPLVAISSEIATELGGTRTLVIAQLRQQREKLALDLAAQATLTAEGERDARTRAGMLGEQLRQMNEQVSQRQRQLTLARERLTKLQLLREQGYVSNSQLADQESTVLDAEVRARDAARQRLDIEQQLASVRLQLRESPVNASMKRHDIERGLADIDQQIAENEARRATILRAPSASTVAALLATPGRFVGAGETAAVLLPQGAKLIARLMVASRAIGFIREGERVVLRYQAYPYQKFGQQYGRVIEISRAALSPSEVTSLTGDASVREQHYRVVVALDRQDIDAYGRAEPLRPGMAVEADILLERRRLIEWVLDPLYAIGRRAAA